MRKIRTPGGENVPLGLLKKKGAFLGPKKNGKTIHGLINGLTEVISSLFCLYRSYFIPFITIRDARAQLVVVGLDVLDVDGFFWCICLWVGMAKHVQLIGFLLMLTLVLNVAAQNSPPKLRQILGHRFTNPKN